MAQPVSTFKEHLLPEVGVGATTAAEGVAIDVEEEGALLDLVT